MSDAPPRSKPLIFIVDDDENILRALRVVLSRLYEVRTCSSSVQSIEEIRAARPDVIILDIKMPERDGFWVFREVGKYAPEVPIIFNSAYQPDLLDDELRSAYKPFAHLNKSDRLPEFLSTVRAALEAGDKKPE